MDTFLFWFWLMRPIADLAAGIGILVICALLVGMAHLPGAIRKMRCKHESVWENRQCQAICRNCGEDLGFIGAWREKHKG